MAHLPPIVKNPHKVLRGIAKEVPSDEILGARIQELILNMRTVLGEAKDGVGLAAPQIGEALRVFLVSEEAEHVDTAGNKAESDEEIEKRKKKEWNYFVYINPIVKKISRQRIAYPEGCLSIPGVFGIVNRPEKITVEAFDEHGKKFTRGASKFFSRVIQHELDHINGVLFIDKAEELLDQRHG